MEDYTGKVFGRWTVLEDAESRRTKTGFKRRRVLALCGCGKTESRVVELSNLLEGKSKSCGCTRIESLKKANTTHGKSRTPTYRIWSAMCSRCLNTKHTSYSYYGGRGLTVCDRWLDSFENFVEDMGEAPVGLTLDRRDNSQGYTPENCRWATRGQQSRNCRNNNSLTYNGKTLLLIEWAETLNIPYDRIVKRVSRLGWSVGQALEFEPRKYKRTK